MRTARFSPPSWPRSGWSRRASRSSETSPSELEGALREGLERGPARRLRRARADARRSHGRDPGERWQAGAPRSSPSSSRRSKGPRRIAGAPSPSLRRVRGGSPQAGDGTRRRAGDRDRRYRARLRVEADGSVVGRPARASPSCGGCGPGALDDEAVQRVLRTQAPRHSPPALRGQRVGGRAERSQRPAASRTASRRRSARTTARSGSTSWRRGAARRPCARRSNRRCSPRTPGPSRSSCSRPLAVAGSPGDRGVVHGRARGRATDGRAGASDVFEGGSSPMTTTSSSRSSASRGDDRRARRGLGRDR